MPPKFDPNDPAVAELIASFEAIGLSKPKATDAARNPKNAATLKEIVDQNDLKGKGLNEKQAALVATLAVQAGNLGSTERAHIVTGISEGKLKSVDQVSGMRVCSQNGSTSDNTDIPSRCEIPGSARSTGERRRVRQGMRRGFVPIHSTCTKFY